MSSERMTSEEMAAEAKRWTAGIPQIGPLVEVPEAVPRARESVAISIRLPRELLGIVKEFAAREGIAYQTLIKRWLDDRVRSERDRRNAERRAIVRTVQVACPPVLLQAAAFVSGSVPRLSVEAQTDEIGRLGDRLVANQSGTQGSQSCSRRSG